MNKFFYIMILIFSAIIGVQQAINSALQRRTAVLNQNQQLIIEWINEASPKLELWQIAPDRENEDNR